jgi:uncharacterized protein (TIGR03118 family)
MEMRSALARLALLLAAALLLFVPSTASAAGTDNSYVVHPLVSDTGAGGTIKDENLVNAWGLTAGPATPWWVADNGTNVSTLYNGNTGAIVPLVVQVAGDGPTGTVFNTTTGFPLPVGTGNARFLFDTEDGVISGWNGGPTSQAMITAKDGAVYKGLAIAQTGAGPRIYATDFHNGKVDVFDGAWQPVHRPFAFFDPTIPRGFAPFGIQTIGSLVFVTYAKTQPGSDDEAHGPGLGFVDAFDATTGILTAKVLLGFQLDAPWGLAQAPDGFGAFSGDLLVGNFGDGRITAFRPILGGILYLPAGQLRDATGARIAIDGLWALEFGNGGAAGPKQSLFFTAGPDDESHGLFGSITAS